MADQDEFERLILALQGADAALPERIDPVEQGGGVRLESWLRALAERGGSDLLLVAGAPPAIRIEGTVHRLDTGPLDSVDIEESVLTWLPIHARRQYREAGIADASF